MKITITQAANGFIIDGDSMDGNFPWVIEEDETASDGYVTAAKNLLYAVVESLSMYCAPNPVDVTIEVKPKE